MGYPEAPGQGGQAGQAAPTRPTAGVAPDLARYRPKPSRLPAAITALVVLLVSSVVLAATMIGHRNDIRQSAAPVAQPIAAGTPAAVPVRDRSIAVSTPEGAGRLVVLRHSWKSSPGARSSAYSRLTVEVQLTCSSGEIGYDPYAFQAFDATGQLFEVFDARGDNALDSGTLGPRQSVRGALVFDMPRGDVTLLMTDERAESVTALRISD